MTRTRRKGIQVIPLARHFRQFRGTFVEPNLISRAFSSPLLSSPPRSCCCTARPLFSRGARHVGRAEITQVPPGRVRPQKSKKQSARARVLTGRRKPSRHPGVESSAGGRASRPAGADRFHGLIIRPTSA
ncbi:hypothetical protein NL676_011573 [Syzygium grande]|nr:hypothetical protein NL676_011573 [Syzygium grande]